MEVKNILISQPRPTTDKSPYFDLERRFGVTLTFKPFIKVESLTPREFRQQKISIPDYTAIVLTSRTACDKFFTLCQALRVTIPTTLLYFCLSETIALYLQKYITYRKRKIHFAETGQLADLADQMKKHPELKYMMPVADVHKEDLTIFSREKIQLTTAVMYRTVSSEMSPDEIRSYDMLVFFTPAGINSLFANDPDYKQGDQRIATFGPTTARTAEERGLRLDIKAPTQQHPSMTAALQHYLMQQQDEA